MIINGISTLTQKGQVAIPKSIRDYFGLKTSDKIHFSIKEQTIIAEPILTTKKMRGFVQAKKSLSKAEMKKIIRESVLRKYAHRS